MATLPLDGVRVLDFCVVWAGPFGTMLLGDLGAEVIKVENPYIMQPMTRGTYARPPRELLARLAPAASGYPDGEPGERPWNYNPTFVSNFRNKKSVTMDLRRPEGMDILRRLVEQSDVVYENNATETMEKLGVTYEWLRSIKPDIIMIRVPAYGSSGPYSQARALGVHLESVTGHTLLRGYADLDPSHNSPIFSADYLAGAQGALAVMMALWHRRKTGKGQLIELAQAENAAAMLFQGFMEHALNGRAHERLGNRDIYGFAPSGVYPCASPGTVEDAEDRWIAITIMSDEEWQALCGAMGNPEWAREPELATQDGRRAQHDLIDQHLAEWTRDQEDYDLFHRLQSLGIAAAPVLEGSRVLDDPHVQARNLFQPQVLHGGVGPYRFNAPFFGFSETPATVRQPPVAFGEHNEEIYRDVIGVSDEEYARLEAEGHISMDFDPSVP